MASKKSFRSRKTDSDDDEDDDGPTLMINRAATKKDAAKKGTKTSSSSSSSSKGASSATKASSSSSSNKPKSSMLSFDEEEEEGGPILKSKKKAFSKKPLRKAMEELEADDEKRMMAAGSGYGTSAGEYTAEKLASLKKDQHFQLSTKPTTEKTTKVTFINPEGEPAAGGGDIDEGADSSIYDDDKVQRLKEKRERNRREAMGDFIPLTRRDEDGHEVTQTERIGLDQASSLAHDEDVENDWESEMIKRGARKSETNGGGGGADHLLSATSAARMGSLNRGGATNVAFKSVESVLKDLKNTKARVDEAHGKNVRAAEKAKSELELVKQGIGKLRLEFDDTAGRFQFFQETREYISSLCGCLREKEGMIKELGDAISQIKRETTERRLNRRIQDQEDELQELKEKGTLQSMQKYSPVLRTLLEKEAIPTEPELDEFGRDKNFAEAGARERRRNERLGRRQKMLKRIAAAGGGGIAGQGKASNDTVEAEANLSGAEDSETEMDVAKIRQNKLLEAAEVIFEDVADEFGSIEPVAHHFEMWKKTYPKDYQTAYVSVGLPQIFDPFVRVEMVRWEPIKPMTDASHEAIEAFAWYTRLFTYGQDENTQSEDDPDDRLVPTMVERVAVPLLQEALKVSYDPSSSIETTRAIAAIQSVLIYEPSKHVIDQLLQAPLDRLKGAVRMVCVPLLRLTADAEAVSIQRKQIFRAVKLFRNIGLWHEVLSAKALAPLALGDILEKMVAPALENRISNSSDRKTTVEVVGTLEAVIAATPPSWLMEKIVSLQTVFKLLDRIAKSPECSGGGPVMTTVTRLKTAFGGSPV